MIDFLKPKAYLVESDLVDEPWIALETSIKRHRGVRSKTMLLLAIALVAAPLIPLASYNFLSSRATKALIATAENGAAAASVTFALPGARPVPLVNSPAPELAGLKATITQDVPRPAVTTSASKPVVRIAKIGVVMPIIEGAGEDALWRGAWRSPWSSTPDQGGNTVLFGHRFLKLPPSPETFFRLDEVAYGDTVEVEWEGEVYTYTVTEIKIVEPNEVSVLKQTQKPTITLITCTPKFTTKQRLVVHATLL